SSFYAAVKPPGGINRVLGPGGAAGRTPRAMTTGGGRLTALQEPLHGGTPLLRQRRRRRSGRAPSGAGGGGVGPAQVAGGAGGGRRKRRWEGEHPLRLPLTPTQGSRGSR